MAKVGVTIGKFMPLHRGHELMIEFGSLLLGKLYVVVSGKETDSISVSTRYNWVCEYVEKNNLLNVRVIYHIDQSPTPINVDENGTVLDKDFQFYWANEFNRIIPSTEESLTHFVSSDMYGKTMADLLGIEWLPVDPKREMVNINATQIRNDPTTFFGYISDVAKAHFTKKIAIVGPESSGKSTVVENLADYFGSEIVTEYGRTLSEIKNNELSTDDFLVIMHGQQALIDIVAQKANSPYVFIDTEAYTTYLFSEIYLGQCIQEIMDFGDTQEIDHYIVLAPNMEWFDDGTRILADHVQRAKFYNDIVKILSSKNKQFTLIEATDYRTRFWNAVDTVIKISG